MIRKSFWKKSLAAVMAFATAASSVTPGAFAAEVIDESGAETASVSATIEEADQQDEEVVIESSEEQSSAQESKKEDKSEGKDEKAETVKEDDAKKDDASTSKNGEKKESAETGASQAELSDASKGKGIKDPENAGKEQKDNGSSETGEKDAEKADGAEVQEQDQEEPGQEAEEKAEKKVRFRLRFDEGSGTVRVILSSDEGADRDDPSVTINKEETSSARDADRKFRNDSVREAVVEDHDSGVALALDLDEGEKVTVVTEQASGFKIAEYALTTDSGDEREFDADEAAEFYVNEDTDFVIRAEKEEIEEKTETGKVFVNLLSDGGTVTISGSGKTYELSKDEKGAVTVREDGQPAAAEKGKYAFSFEAEDGEEMTVTAQSEEGVVTAFSIGNESGSSFEPSEFDAEEKPAEFTQAFTVSKDAAKVISVSFADMPEFEGEQRVGDVNITVKAERGIFPAGVTFKAVDIFDREHKDVLLEAMAQTDGAMLFAVDITFYDKDGNEIQPNGMVKVAFEGIAEDTDEVSVVHVSEDDKAETGVVEAEVNGDDVIMESNSFSPYIVLSKGSGKDNVPNPSNDNNTYSAGTTAVPTSVTAIGTDEIDYRNENSDYKEAVLGHTGVLTITDTNHGDKHFRAFCADPYSSGIDQDEVPVTKTNIEKITSKNLIKALYYGQDDFGENEASRISGSARRGKILVHYAVCYYTRACGICDNMSMNEWNGESDRPNYVQFWTGTSDALRRDVAAYMEFVESAPVPDGVTGYIFYPNAGNRNTSKDQPYVYMVRDVAPAEFHVEKSSSNTAFVTGNNKYKLSGAEYWVYTGENGMAQAQARREGASRITVLTTDANGETPPFKAEPNETYYIIEGKASPGYVCNNTVHTVKAVAGKDIAVTEKEKPQDVTLVIYKRQTGRDRWRDAELPLNGARFVLYDSWKAVTEDDASKRIRVDGLSVFTTDEEGKVSIGPLPVKKYWALEKTAPAGYNRYTGIIAIDASDVAAGVPHTTVTKTVYNSIGVTISVQKNSSDPGMTDGKDCYSLKDAVFGIYSDEACTQLVTTLTTDENGFAATEENALKEQNYWVKEISPSKGFDVDPDTHKVSKEDFAVSAAQVLTITEPVDMDPFSLQIEKRDKTNSADAKPLSGATFSAEFYEGVMIGSKEDLAGKTASRSWTLTTYKDGNRYVANFKNSEHVTGSEFYRDEDGEIAFPIGTLVVKETGAAEGYKNDADFGRGSDILIVQFAENHNKKVKARYVVGGDVVNNGAIVVTDTQDELPTVSTTASDVSTGVQLSLADSSVTIRDKVSCKNLEVGKTYTLEGVLMDKDTGKELLVDGKQVKASKTFTASAKNATETMDFTFEADSSFEGKTVVVFERLLLDGEEKASHKNINDAAQTVHFPEMGTLLQEKGTDAKTVEAGAVVELEDIVAYENLLPNTDYTVKGVLKDRDTKEDLMVGGKAVEASANFRTTTKTSGTVTVTFTVDTTGLGGKHLVAYEQISTGGKVVAKHEDLNDAGQTVDVNTPGEPTVGTTASDVSTGMQLSLADSSVTIRDKVSCGNLEVGKTYTLEGVLMDKDTGNELLVDGKQVKASKTFTASAKDITETMDFTFKAPKDFEGKTVVVFETLSIDGEEKASHKNINDAAQTVHFPGMGTLLQEKGTGAKSVTAGKVVELEDTVAYENLLPGKKYTVSGVLKDKAAGEDLVIGGKSVTASAEFTAQKESGTVVVTFTVDTKGLGGKSLVAYEQISTGGKVVAKHEDINDEGQTFSIVRKPSGGTLAKDSETLDHIAKADESVTIIDEVKYAQLTPGEEYEITGTLMDKTTGSAIVAGGSPVSVTKKFTPDKEDGTYTMEFTLNASKLNGHDVVVFEVVKDSKGETAFSHEDISDEGQTIHFPDGSTTAKDKATGTHTAKAAKEAVITDEVVYKNLLVGKEYTVSGTLMDKATGKALMIDEKPVTAEKTFTADKKDGSVTLEFRFDASKLGGKKIVAFEKVKYKDVEVFVHEDINDRDQTVIYPEVGTLLKDKTSKGQVVLADGEVELVDTVSYKSVVIGEKYTVSGILKDKATEEDLMVGGEKVMASAEFTAEKEEGTIEVVFKFNAKELDGKTLVAFEDLICNGEVVANHRDINDEKQTVYIPSGKTTAKDSETLDHIAKADEKVTITDEVEYHNLVPGKEYTITGTLMNKSTGKAVVSGGKEVTVTEKFTPDSADGTHTMTFTFDGKELKGLSAVVFETVELDGAKVFVHTNINDKDQTIDFPGGSTTATDKATGSHTAKVAESVTITDEVKYKNLLVGKEYTVSGTLMDKATGKALVIDGKPVKAEKTFTADKKDGSVTLEFTFNSSDLGGKKIVAFEKVLLGDKEVFVHEDINDADQTVSFPKVGTYLKDKSTNEQFALADSDVELVDTVSYENVTVGDTYTVKGTLMDKETKEAFTQNGEPVTASAKFTAEKESGTVEVTFKFNTKDLDGKALVAYEDLSCNGEIVTSHNDIDDAKQTVTVPSVTTEASGKKTKEKTVLAHKDEVILDDVSYTGLIAGKEYAVSGKVKVQEESKDWNSAEEVASVIVSADANGKGTAKIEDGKVLFTPAGEEGEVVDGVITIGFRIDGSDLAGEKLVVGETVEYNGKKIAVHEDLHDEPQIVYVPKGETAAVDTMTGIKNTLAADNRIFKDTFSYEKLEVGKEYIFTGEVVVADRDENGETVKDENGNVIVRKIDSVMVNKDGSPVEGGCYKFTPKTEDGQIELYFMVDATELANREVTVFEDVTRNGEPVIVHHVLDGSQTVYVPEGATTAVDSETNDKVAMPDEDVSIIDTLVFKNLVPGKEYTVSGQVMRKDGEGEVPSVISAAAFAEGTEGEEITIEEGKVKFIPVSRDGELKLTFVFNASELKGKDVVVFERVYHNGSEVIIHENLNDEDQTIHFPNGWTQAADPDTDDRTMKAGGEVKIKDRFFYENLVPGRQYAVSGKVMLKPMNGEEPAEIPAKMVDADGNEVKDHIFTPQEKDGYEDIFFVINSDELAGRSAVMFETMEYVNPDLEIRTVIAEHKDINDEEQTIHFPDGGTTAVDSETVDHIAKPDEKVTVYDEVFYKNLIPGKTYTIKGVLMDKATEKALIADGAEVRAEDTFTAEKPNGSRILAFTFNASALNGHTTVAYETMYSNGKEVFVHADLEDEDQTVRFPDGGTTAVDEKTKDHISYAEKTATIFDEVRYENLIPGKEYTVTGVMMDKATEKPLIINGKEVTASQTFTAREGAGSVTLRFTFDASALAGRSIVAFETVTYNGKEVFMHRDITDKDQTVDFPSLKTSAKDKAGNDSQIATSGSVTVIDTVTYTNLLPGKEYVIKGVLMDKSTKAPVTIGGKQVTGRTSFKPKSADGSEKVTFTFNAKDLKKGDYVVFEELYFIRADKKEVPVADHKDLNDRSQTVTRPETPTPEKPRRSSPRTGDDTPILPWAAAFAAGLAGLAAVLLAKRRKKED